MNDPSWLHLWLVLWCIVYVLFGYGIDWRFKNTAALIIGAMALMASEWNQIDFVRTGIGLIFFGAAFYAFGMIFSVKPQRRDKP